MSWENLSLPRNTFNLLLDGREYPTAQNPKMRITTGILIVFIGKNFFPNFPQFYIQVSDMKISDLC